jgi:hypothetical protein
MVEERGPWQVRNRVQKYSSEFVLLCENEVTRPDGQPGTYATVTLKPGVAVLPMDEDGNVHLTEQFRFALGRNSMEVASGTLEDGEDPLSAAKRELKEELVSSPSTGPSWARWISTPRSSRATFDCSWPGRWRSAQPIRTRPKTSAARRSHSKRPWTWS